MPNENTNENSNPAAANAAEGNNAADASLLGAGLSASGTTPDAAKAAADAAAQATAGKTAGEGNGTAVKNEENLTPEQKLALEKQKATDQTKEGAPADGYKDFTAPEGMELDKETMGNFLTVAKEYNLSQDKAQKLVDLAASQVQKVVTAQQTAAAAAQQQMVKGWKDEITGDKEFGGANLPVTLQLAHKAIAHFTAGDKTMEEALKTAWGSNPGFIRTFARIGKAMSEDRVVSGANAASSSKRSAAEVMYDGK